MADTKTTNEPSRRTRLLSDRPADEDTVGGGHDRVAQALVDLISEEEGGKAIALSGPYGSGKSTAIRLLNDKLDERESTDGIETHIFTYDAWEHQGDPLRRSFIENLIEFLRDQELKWAEKEDWVEEENQLSQREETIDTTVKPGLTWPGRFVAASLLLVPLGYVLFQQIGQEMSLWGMPLWTIGLTISFLPFVVAIGTYVCWRPWSKKQCRLIKMKLDLDEWKWRYFFKYHRVPNHDSSVFNLFVREERKEIQTNKIRTPDPTTLEFQRIFHRILRTTLEGQDRQLIIVVDNLDRLSSEQALSTWATMRTFFEQADHKKKDWFGRFWLIVPFDLDALGRIWEVDGGGRTDGSSLKEESRPENTGGENENQSEERGKKEQSSSSGFNRRLQAFVDKTFRVTYRVPPPVLTNWKRYMLEELEKAFPDHEQGELRPIYRLYQLEGITEGPPTPREIKLFINRLSALYRQWGEQIGLPLQAVYELTSNELSRDGHRLTENDFLKYQTISVLREEKWDRYLAALHFNVDPYKAIQVLIGEDLRTALEEGEPGTLQEYQEVSDFPSVVEEMLSEVLGLGDPVFVATSGYALQGVEESSDDVGTKALQQLWGRLQEELLRLEKWHPRTMKQGKGLAAILRHVSGGRRSEVARHLLEVVSTADLAKDPATWTDGLIPIIRFLQETGHEELLEQVLHVPGTGKQYVEIMTRLTEQVDAGNAEQLAALFTPATKPEIVTEVLEEMVRDGALRSSHADALRLMCYVRSAEDEPIEWSLKAVADALHERLNVGKGIVDEELRGNLEAMLVVADVYREQAARNHLENNDGIGNIFHHLHNHRSETEIAALCILTQSIFNPNGSSGSNKGNANNGRTYFNQLVNTPAEYEETVNSVANFVIELGNVQSVVRAADSSDHVRKLAKFVVQKVGQREDAIDYIDAELLCAHADLLYEALGKEEFGEFVERLLQKGDLSTELQRISKEQWLAEMKSESRLLDAIVYLVDKEDIELGSAFSDALRDHARQLLQGKTQVERLHKEEWKPLVDALSESERSVFFKNLYDVLLEQYQKPLEPVLNLYGDQLVHSGVLAKNRENETVRKLFAEIVSRCKGGELRWLQKALSEHAELLASADAEINESFKGRVRDKFPEVEGEPKELLRGIAEMIEVELPEESLDDESDSES